MENEIAATVSGTIEKIEVSEGDVVAAGAVLLVIDMKD